MIVPVGVAVAVLVVRFVTETHPKRSRLDMAGRRTATVGQQNGSFEENFRDQFDFGLAPDDETKRQRLTERLKAGQ